MTPTTNRIRHVMITALVIVVLALVIAVPLVMPAAAQDGERISRPGEYRGYSEPIYDDWVRISQYVPVRDGTRLAVDIFRPAVDGQPVDDPLPVLWTHHRYHRATEMDNGELFTILTQAPELETALYHGYVIGVVDVRGGGASFGTRRGEFTREETQDAYDITEWFAVQPWCDGNIGMFGLSYLAITQYLAASTQPPHLKAIMPMMALFDLYSFVYPGGVFADNYVENWGTRTILLDKIKPAAPVDDDTDGALLQAARAEHRDNANIYLLAQERPFRDSNPVSDSEYSFSSVSPSSYIDAINASGVAVYTVGGWYDMFPRDAVTWFNNLTVPQKLILTPWSHNGSGGFDMMAEHLRWFDYWLKGIDNGIMDEPPVYYSVIGASDDESGGPNDGSGAVWYAADEWPLPEETPTPMYLHAGPSGSVESVNDGLLSLERPSTPGEDASSMDVYSVDYTTTTGTTTRWVDGYGGGFGYPDMRSNDEKGLTFTTPPLEQAMQLTGHPVAHLWITASVEDIDVFVYVEEVAPDGTSTYLTEGVLKASHRALQEPPFDTMELPFHRGNAADVSPLPEGEPVELVFDLLPISVVFDAGNRLRFTITGADADNYLTEPCDPAPTLTVYRSAEYPSHVVLPVIPAD
ncbi:MAG: CocE/NonD family hydrolase [Anaerolineae bacterium]|nr:CocE/NonD family hydrolase [Anaerolineae bacterium]